MEKAKFERDRKELVLIRASKLCYGLDQKKIRQVKHLKAKIKDLITNGNDLNFNRKSSSYNTHHVKLFSANEQLDALFCLYDSSFLIPELNSQLVKNKLDRIYNDVVVVGDDDLVIKVSSLEICRIENGLNRDKEDCQNEQDLLHEYFVGSIVTNSLRIMVPNFHLLYAGFKLNSSKQIECDATEKEECLGSCPCDTNQVVDYLLYERIDGITITEALKFCGLKDYLSWLTQILLSLELGQIEFGFVHNNLHTDNVYIRKLDDNHDIIWLNPKLVTRDDIEKARKKTCYVKYYHDNTIYYVKSKSVATIINYDLAHVRVPFYTHEKGDIIEKVEDFGPIGYEDKGIYEKDFNRIKDSYKLIMWTLKILLEFNRELFDQVKKIGKIFGFVYQHELLKVLNNEKEFNLSGSDLVIKDLINFIKQEFPQMKDILVPAKEFSTIPRLIKSDSTGSLEILNNQRVAISLGEFLDFFPNLETIMGRYDGLLFYVNSMKRNDLIPELEQYVQTVMRGKNYLLNREQETRKRAIQEINRLIVILNQDIINNGQMSIIDRCKLARKKKMIEAKIELLNDQFLWINKFKRNFVPDPNNYLDDRIIEMKDF